jgi:radical SAM superfamily enzyme YgiQ (UPF0313 family)
MPEVVRLLPQAGVPRRGKILFAGMMRRLSNNEPVNSLAYLSPGLQQAGYEVVVSQAETFPKNTIQRLPGETARALSVLHKEISEERPEFVAFPTYDNNAPFVFQAAEAIQQSDQPPGLILGAAFITINPKAAQGIFGGFPNIIMVNGEAEYALPTALQAYAEGTPTSAPGILVQKGGKFLGGDFLQRVSLTAEEHEALEPNFDINQFTYNESGGLNVVTSRGCFEGCSFCAASRLFRSRHVTWSTGKKIAMIRKAHEWLRSRGMTRKSAIGFHDDNFFFNLRAGIEFLAAFRDEPLADEVELVPQFSLGSLFLPDGRFSAEVPNLMLRPDGTPFVRRISVGIDYWSRAERRRNKGGQQGKLTDEQIKTAIAAFVEKKIAVHAYWLLGDEQTTLTSFSQGMLYLSELLLDHGPYFMVDWPEPVELRTGTPIRDRVLAAREKLPQDYIQEADRVGTGEHQIVFYHPIYPPDQIVNYLFKKIAGIGFMQTGGLQISPDLFLSMMWAITDKWRDEILDKRQRKHLRHYLELRSKGGGRSEILNANPPLRRLGTVFTFLGDLLEFDVEELLVLSEIERRIPACFKAGPERLSAERLRRNPYFDQQLAELRAKGRI